jgi:uncharacterized Zn finger protein
MSDQTPKKKKNKNKNTKSSKRRRRSRSNSVSTGPRKAQGGIKTRSDEGDEFARNWWARRWLQSMENLVDIYRLQRGQRYARMGQVLSMDEANGVVVARVQGSRSKPYRVVISLEPLSNRQWEKVFKVLAERAIFAAQLLVGEMPVNIEEAFSAANVNLFPVRTGDLMGDCSCPDWANPCKHVAAAHYILGDRFDEDPFLLFRLRGRTQEQVLEGMRRYRNGQPGEETSQQEQIEEAYEDVAPLTLAPLITSPEALVNFWRADEPLDDFAVSVSTPEIPLPVFKRLGEPDIAGSESIAIMLEDVYNMLSQAAMIIAYTGEEVDEDSE